ncbi:para-nitrobenzyl esterase [Sporothrix brasiliensis 5110]|uniref:Para-nitrobenzyl esterase n=1 Tax=Sporothrix brasiliensis 5110 TaxID=1398154 RepID=A0A0C2FNK9_9PEZI|nr:para-nitrobenzyl esterase [Sporothrix brasiliensis 5110]KIH92613.1 para-nitrobenzyl esterase [Sporothrix brasiliensis 5110]
MKVLSILGLAAIARAVDPLVTLNYTQLQGSAIESSGVTQWLGVRYAAAPVGDLRFAAPINPPTTTDVQDATQFQAVCLPRNPSDFTMHSKRFNVSEDCLFANIFAPSNATNTSALPVLFFIQGGGFSSNSNANFNGSDLATFGNIIVVQINYRVGPYGFLQSREVQNNGSLNNGLKDQIQGLQWVQQNIAQFGGDPKHIVASGDSAGATSLGLLLAAWDEQDPRLIKGAILESPSVATLRTLDQGQEQYNCLLQATNCTLAANTLSCLRAVNATALQTEQCQFNPHLDNDLVRRPMLQSFDEGRFLHVPIIAGTCADEGTKNVPSMTNTTGQALRFIDNRVFNVLSNASLALLNTTYLLTNHTGVIAVANTFAQFPSSGPLWRPLANAAGDIAAHCITARLQNAIAREGVKTFNYRFAVRDEEQERLGFGSYHTVELNAVFGPNNTDGNPPKSYREGQSNAAIVPATMAYWTSFVKALDPNDLKLAGMPDWTAWAGPEGRQRLRFQTNATGLEVMPDDQVANCEMLEPMLPAIETISAPGTVVRLNPRGQKNGTSWAQTAGQKQRSAAAGRAGGAANLVGTVAGLAAVMAALVMI